MFGYLSEKFHSLYQNIRGQRLSTQDVDRVLKEVEFYLLEADAPYESVKHFLDAARVDLEGEKYPKHLNAQQAIVKTLYDRLTELLGSNPHTLPCKAQPTRILVEGLQGSGKTTSVIKLAAWLKQQKKKVLVVSFDIHRPAARIQTRELAQKVGVECVGADDATLPELISESLKRSKYYDVLIMDTAGRTELDDRLMQELVDIDRQVQPHERLYVLDAMAGQAALKVAMAFNEKTPLTGAIVTKLDSDARGGAILGLKQTLNIPIAFLSLGEHVERTGQWTIFYPDRIAQRILGMGDMLSLIEKLEQSVSDRQKAEMDAALKNGQMNFENLRSYMQSIREMAAQQGGGMKGILQSIPGMGAAANNISSAEIEAPMKKSMALIDSMTPKERKNPALLEQGGRKIRIAKGAGMQIAELNQLIKQLKQFQQMMDMVSKNPGKLQAMMSQFQQHAGR